MSRYTLVVNYLEQFFIVTLLIQVAHSIEELCTGFHKKWYLFKMPFLIFLVFELSFSALWVAVLIFPNFPNRVFWQELFLVLMFANGVQHLVWAGSVKKYVPGLITAPLHLITFLVFYSRILI